METWNGSDWATAVNLTTIGYKRIQRLPSPVTTSQVRIRITGSRLEPTLAEVGLFKQAVAVAAPTISERSASGSVTIANSDGLKMVYTTDGTAPTTKSAVYASPLSMPQGGTVQAACLTTRGTLGMVASKSFLGLAPLGWKVAASDSQENSHPAANAIDGDPSTFWLARANADPASPHFLTVDMSSAHRIAGFTYLPRQDGTLDGIVDTYRFETSTDGRNWATNVPSGRFGNIRNNPTLQDVSFAPVTARYFRFTALQELTTNACASAAEISVLPAGSASGQ